MGSSLGKGCQCICGGPNVAKGAQKAKTHAAPAAVTPRDITSASTGSGPTKAAAIAPAGQADDSWLFQILALTFLALALPVLAESIGLSALFGRLLVLTLVGIYVYKRLGSSRASSTRSLELVDPALASGAGDSADTEPEEPLEQLQRLLAEADQAFGAGGNHPTTDEEYKAQGWSCDITSSSRVYLQFPKDPPPARVLGDIRMNTVDQVPDFPIILVNEQGELRGGAGPVYLSVSTWPSWFPFVNKCVKLGTLTDTEEIWHVQVKVAIVKADCVVMGSFQDRLDEEGKLQVVFIAPPSGSEGKQWLGVTIPPRVGQLRIPVNKMRLVLWPETEGTAKVHFQVDYVDLLGDLFQWVVKLAFTTLSKLVVPEIKKQINAFEGSSLQAFLRDPANSTRKSLYLQVHQRIRTFVAAKNAAGVGAIPS